MTCDVWFYHLERSSLDDVLPELLERTLARGWRALVRGIDRSRLAQMDDRLWTWKAESFIGHGLDDAPHPERQPVLLTDAVAEAPNGAHVLFLIDDAEPGALDGYERCLILFDGRNQVALKAARTRWRTVTAAGHPVSYWRQVERGWEKQA